MHSLNLTTILFSTLIWLAFIPANADYFPSTGRYCLKLSNREQRIFNAATVSDRQLRRGEHHTFFAKPLGDDLSGQLVYQVIPLNGRVYQALSELNKGQEFCLIGTYLNRNQSATILAFDL
ncbi:MAG: hypothetical protein HN353_12340 [Bdellovibrionales bacterium]|jgi:hypothetical protein|nr:hypothetical protein [Bdellovibrionales bacterium]MBT3526304.1 hypothetical protein [Bdellovibrionales bacterium]MBT7670546.1 hypothetical protein [Bdellovibrionales bacterium]MBT7767844.1 hypothetical protein [Bdellovibrionales bacterium]